MNLAVNQYLENVKQWQDEIHLLRSILLNIGLTEELKWGKPCYTFNNSNIVMIQSFKDHCDLGFFKGALLTDRKKILTKAGEHTQAARQMRFTNCNEIKNLKTVISTYVKEAIEVEKSGKVLTKNQTKQNIVIEELAKSFESNLIFKKAFESLTLGRQRAYMIYFSNAKQTETRQHRIEKYIPRIILGKGINDCTCGLSKRMPNCDGSHKILKK